MVAVTEECLLSRLRLAVSQRYGAGNVLDRRSEGYGHFRQLMGIGWGGWGQRLD